jgi:DNA-binding NarL/FixJ family response regulator
MTLLVIHPHPLIQEALRVVLRELAPTAAFVAGDTLDHVAARVVPGTEVELAVVDVTAGGEPALALVGAVRARHPGAPIVVASSGGITPGLMFAAARLGAVGCITMAHDVDAIRRTLAEVLASGRMDCSDPATAAALASVTIAPRVVAAPTDAASLAASAARGTLQAEAAARADAARRLGLTPRQSDVLDLLVRGLSNKLISRELGLSPSTVKIHVSAVLRALHARSRTEAVIAAASHGFMPIEPGGGAAVTARSVQSVPARGAFAAAPAVGRAPFVARAAVFAAA